MKIPILTTERLRLRELRLTDVDLMQQILIGKDVLQYFPEYPPFTKAQTEKMITKKLEQWEQYGHGIWAVETLENNILIGRCGLGYLPDTDEIEVGYILGRDFWGKGYATEAAKASLNYGFTHLEVNEIVGIVHVDNIGSQHVLQKIGMSHTNTKEYFGLPCYRYMAKKY